jgi:hypothetical protein
MFRSSYHEAILLNSDMLSLGAGSRAVQRRIGVVVGQVKHWMVPQVDGPSARRPGARLLGASVPLPAGEPQHDYGRPAQPGRRLLQARWNGRVRPAAARPLHVRPAADLPRSHQPRQAGTGPELRRLLAQHASRTSPDFPQFVARTRRGNTHQLLHCMERTASRLRNV